MSTPESEYPEYHGWPKDGGIGEPIQPMLDIAKSMVDRMLHHGDMGVRIFTARVCPVGRPAQNDCEEQRRKIEAWCEEHIGMRLPVCHEKDFRMVALYDDRAEGVEQNTGKIISRELSAATERAEKAERERDEAQRKACRLNELAGHILEAALEYTDGCINRFPEGDYDGCYDGPQFEEFHKLLAGAHVGSCPHERERDEARAQLCAAREAFAAYRQRSACSRCGGSGEYQVEHHDENGEVVGYESARCDCGEDARMLATPAPSCPHQQEAERLRKALAALGSMPDGYCFCPEKRDPAKPDEQHAGECREARAVVGGEEASR